MPVQIGTAIISGTMGYNRLQVQSPILLPGTPVASTTKGLLNGPGQNNCFLNCAVQVCVVYIYLNNKYYSIKYGCVLSCNDESI